MYNCCFALVFWRAVLSVGLQCGRVVASMCLFTILERSMTIAVSGAFAESLSPSWVGWIDSHAWWVRSGCFAPVRCFVVVPIELDGLVCIINLSVYSFLCWLAMLPRVTGLIRAHDRCVGLIDLSIGLTRLLSNPLCGFWFGWIGFVGVRLSLFPRVARMCSSGLGGWIGLRLT